MKTPNRTYHLCEIRKDQDKDSESNKRAKEFVHTLNNTVIAPPRMLIAFLENNLQEDGSVLIPKVLQPYMGGKEKLIPNKS